MSLLLELSDLFGRAFVALGFEAELGEVVPAQRPEFGHFQCNGALMAASRAGVDPRQVAGDVITGLSPQAPFSDVHVAGPGFINITVTDAHVAAWMARVAADDRCGIPTEPQPQRVVVDYGGPNISKALHIGHLRSTIIGDSLLRHLRYAGHDAVGDIHIGDWGTPIGIMIAELERREPSLPYFEAGLEGPYPAVSPVTIEDLQLIYPAAAARAEADPDFAERARLATVELQRGRPGYVALWKHFSNVSRASHQADFHALGVDFDLWYGESTVSDRLASLIDSIEAGGHTVKSEGALVVEVAEPDDRRQIPPLMLVRSDGGYLYSTTDLATIQMRVEELEADVILYVVDARQALHFEQLFRAARKAGIAPKAVVLEHVPFGTVNGPDGKPFRTREGGVILLADVIGMVQRSAHDRLAEAELAQDYPQAEREEIARLVGLAALKFGDLANHRTSNYTFDLDRFASFEGKTGPYLQYSGVRMRSIMRKAAELGLRPGSVLPPSYPEERELMLTILRSPEVFVRSVQTRAPNHTAEFAYEIATRFNRFYDRCHVLGQEDPDLRASWLSLVATSNRTLELLLSLLGITVPDRM